MRLFIDTEFNGFGGALMSLAIVAEDGREFYEVVTMNDPVEPWVELHVVPLLDRMPVTPEYFRHELREFLRGFDHPIIVADWYTDFVHFFEQFGGRHHGESFDYGCSARLLSGPMDIKSERPHNALSDARALRDYVMARVL